MPARVLDVDARADPDRGPAPGPGERRGDGLVRLDVDGRAGAGADLGRGPGELLQLELDEGGRQGPRAACSRRGFALRRGAGWRRGSSRRGFALRRGAGWRRGSARRLAGRQRGEQAAERRWRQGKARQVEHPGHPLSLPMRQTSCKLASYRLRATSRPLHAAAGTRGAQQGSLARAGGHRPAQPRACGDSARCASPAGTGPACRSPRIPAPRPAPGSRGRPACPGPQR